MTRLVPMTSLLALAAIPAAAQEQNFNRVASFPVAENLPQGADRLTQTSAEIIAATPDGQTIVYSDSPLGAIGMIDIADPANPQAMGSIDVDGEPTSVTVIGRTAFVSVNTSESYTDPSGALRAYDLDSGERVASCDLGGQPDAIAAAPDGSFLSIAIENERDEDAGDGRVPQMPPGHLAIIQIADGAIECDSLQAVDLTGLADVAPGDPEPEYVDINDAGETVVTLQENNHVVVVDADGSVIADMSAGSVDLQGIDTAEDGRLAFDDTQDGRLREPDTVVWIDDQHFAMANEGDMDGGSRGWTIMGQDGSVVYESGNSFEQALAEIGHYPEGRSDAKGVEPESAGFGTFNGTPLVFIGSERGSVFGVYDVTDPASPALRQLLPSGIGPESIVTLPDRGLVVTTNEEDLQDDGARAHVMVFEMQDGPATYPMVTSAGMDDLTGWGALSGLAAMPDGTIKAVSDSFYATQPRIYTIDPGETPARITDAMTVTRHGQPAQKLDMEGIAPDGQGGYWIASEGDAGDLYPHAILHVGDDGAIEEEIAFPDGLTDASRRHAAEGIALHDGRLWIAMQRAWDDDPENHAKLVSYDIATGEWGAVLYPLETVDTGWVGLSEITIDGDTAYLIERDNQLGQTAEVKMITSVALDQLQPAPIGGDLPVVDKTQAVDLIPHLKATGGFVQDKVEGLAIMEDGTAWVVTDNDGVDDATGETMFFQVDLTDQQG